MGLGPAGCAAAAGISEALLAGWRKDASFDKALQAAFAMADAHQVAPRGRINGFGLGVLLRCLAQGVRLGPAAAVVGLTPAQLKRLRKANTELNSLIETAILQGRRHNTPGRNYRLVQLDGDAMTQDSRAHDGKATTPGPAAAQDSARSDHPRDPSARP
ncbi:hypothetical protein [Streptomyces sp. NPDC001568]|uniref:hypothetical protein n=1 Tax=Streptomyces sp. NPDC001568 TaxID=3364588 RepID=UPI0036AAD096